MIATTHPARPAPSTTGPRDAWEAGLLAFARGEPMCANPHARATAARAQWADGWISGAEADVEEEGSP